MGWHPKTITVVHFASSRAARGSKFIYVGLALPSIMAGRVASVTHSRMISGIRENSSKDENNNKNTEHIKKNVRTVVRIIRIRILMRRTKGQAQ